MPLPHDALILIIVDTVLLALATSAVVLRFSISQHQGSSPQADDWTILAALVFAIAICLVGIYDSATGLLGVSLFEMSQSIYVRYRKALFAEILIGQNVYGLVKISVILFYRRIFQSKQFKLITNIVMVLPILYMVTSFFVVFFCARNVSSFWTTPVELEGTEYVLKFGPIIVSLTIVDIALDLIILVLPLPVIKGLQIEKKQKIHVSGIFLLGAFCLVSSGIRLFYTIPLVSKSTSVTKLIGFGDNNELWSHIEACAAVFTACLPTYAPLYRGFKSAPLVTRTKSLLSFHKNHAHKTSTKVSIGYIEASSRGDILMKNKPRHTVQPEWV